MNAATLAKSPRLQAVQGVLMDGKWHTTADISLRTGGCAIHSDIAELRANGLNVHSRYVRTTDAGRRVYAYRLEA